MAKNFLSENDIERALLQKLQDLHGFDVLDCMTVKPEDLNDSSHILPADELSQQEESRYVDIA